MIGIVISTVVYLVAAYFVKRQLVEEMGIPRGVTRGSVIFIGAAVLAYAAAYLVDRVVS